MGLAAFNRMRRLKAEQAAKEVEVNKELPSTQGFGVSIEYQHPKSLVELTVKELKEMAKSMGLKGYSNKNESEIVEMIMKAREGND